jgi:hypothetical protein
VFSAEIVSLKMGHIKKVFKRVQPNQRFFSSRERNKNAVLQFYKRYGAMQLK